MLKLHRPSPALVIACVALFVAASGSAWAATTTQTGTRATTATPGKPKMKRGPRGFPRSSGSSRTPWRSGARGPRRHTGPCGAPGGRHRARQHQRHRRLCHLHPGPEPQLARVRIGGVLDLEHVWADDHADRRHHRRSRQASCNPDNAATARNTVIHGHPGWNAAHPVEAAPPPRRPGVRSARAIARADHAAPGFSSARVVDGPLFLPTGAVPRRTLSVRGARAASAPGRQPAAAASAR